jgi:hypothetical protein
LFCFALLLLSLGSGNENQILNIVQLILLHGLNEKFFFFLLFICKMIALLFVVLHAIVSSLFEHRLKAKKKKNPLKLVYNSNFYVFRGFFSVALNGKT